MLTTEMIDRLFIELNAELEKEGITGEVVICGGAVMCLVFKTRCSTRDVDAIFAPANEMRKAIGKVAKKLDVPEDWLNDTAKGFPPIDPPKREVLKTIFNPPALPVRIQKVLPFRARIKIHHGGHGGTEKKE